eukprot:NODE_4858_length_731_cov_18.836093_g4695_i0.p1 GENE.NODE_4858_length_731_cov_18.836093_g4695_i0~~NODE_4858_length_731_cov_18.836093_g4695_i0.p1  ORF type:complete len:210 (-),score=67.94 NODE_4858_length_731_cov_18.836093_g4695_i0:100-672(-)
MGKALAAIPEAGLVAFAFTASYKALGTLKTPFISLFLMVLPFILASYALNYSVSFLMLPEKAQLFGVGMAFVLAFLNGRSSPSYQDFMDLFPPFGQVIPLINPHYWIYGQIYAREVRSQPSIMRAYLAPILNPLGFKMVRDQPCRQADLCWRIDTSLSSGFVDINLPIWILVLVFHAIALAVLHFTRHKM